MAKVKLNPTFEAIHGKIGDLVYKQFGSLDIVARIPDRTGIVPTAEQLVVQGKFRVAALYGKSVMADPVTKQLYQDAADRKGIPLFALMVADFLNPPAVDEIDLAGYSGAIGDVIKIRASDELKVEGVTVAIRESGGEVLEEGAAVWTAASATWNYTATTALAQGQSVSIEVTATDKPGHTTTRTQARS